MRANSAKLLAALVRSFGPDEIMLMAGLALVTVALWSLAERWIGTGRPALLIPGLVATWIALPARSPFVVRPPIAAQKREPRPR